MAGQLITAVPEARIMSEAVPPLDADIAAQNDGRAARLRSDPCPEGKERPSC